MSTKRFVRSKKKFELHVMLYWILSIPGYSGKAVYVHTRYNIEYGRARYCLRVLCESRLRELLETGYWYSTHVKDDCLGLFFFSLCYWQRFNIKRNITLNKLRREFHVTYTLFIDPTIR